MDKENSLYCFLVDNEIATENEINLVTDINCFSVEAMEDIIYARTAYRTVVQLWECERDNFYFSSPLIQAFNLE